MHEQRNQKFDKMRNSQEYKTMLQKNIDWLKQLDATDSNPNNGRVDISVFNAKVSQYGYEPTIEIKTHTESGKPIRGGIGYKLPDVDINTQAQSMTDKYNAKKFGL